MPALAAQEDEQSIDRSIAGLNRTELASPSTADGGRSAPISLTMIRNFADHSANERTFLAWVRTAIAVMAFGFIVEKFDLFLEVAAPSLVGRPLSLPGHRFGNIAGLALIALGIAMVAVAAARFLITAKNIDSEQQRPGMGSRIDIALAALLVLLGSALFVYLSRASGHKAVTPAARQLARAHIAHFASCARIDNNSCRRSVLVFG